MSSGFMEYVVDHSHAYPKKSASTHQLNDEPAVVPRTMLDEPAPVPGTGDVDDSAVHLKKSRSRSSRSAIKLVTKSASNTHTASTDSADSTHTDSVRPRPELPKARSFSSPSTSVFDSELAADGFERADAFDHEETADTFKHESVKHESADIAPVTESLTPPSPLHHDAQSPISMDDSPDPLHENNPLSDPNAAFIDQFNQSLEPLHPSNDHDSTQAFKISTVDQLETLLQFSYDDHRNPLPRSESVFPYLHGINNIKQRMFFIDKLDYDQPALPAPAAAVLASGSTTACPSTNSASTSTFSTNSSTSTTKRGAGGEKHLKKKRLLDELYNVDVPEVRSYFNLLTVECDTPFYHDPSKDGDKLINSIPLRSLLTPRSVETDGCRDEDSDHDDGVEYIENIEYEPFDAINRFDSKSVQLKNRNFCDQVKLMAPFAHFLVYDPFGETCGNDTLTQRAANTIEQLTNPEYDQFVYVVQRSVFHQFREQSQSRLFLESRHDSVNQPINSVNNQPFSCKLLKLEQNLIWKTHSMKWVYQNVCIGNLIDFTYLTNHQYQALQQPKEPRHDYTFKLYINCHENARFPNLSLLKELLRNASGPPELRNKLLQKEILLEFPSSGTVNCEEITWDETLSFLNTLKLIDYYTRVLQQKVFIFCYDGFTGLSLLTLALGNLWDGDFFEDVVVRLMRREQVKLYYFKNDVIFLKKFEKFLYWFKSKHLQPDTAMMTQMVSDLHYEEMNNLYKGVIRQRMLELESSVSSKVPLGYDGFGGDWFDWECDNNFPARIYDNLFLGSLTHACSKTILATCGITTVVSIGEKPAWLEELGVVFEHEAGSTSNKKVMRPLYSFFNGIGTAHIYEVKMAGDDAHCAPPKKVPHLKSVVYIHNVKDDGRDSIMPLLEGCPESVQQKIIIAPRTGCDEGEGNTLIHCKIGVSRSASLVMASVMKYKKMNLLEAYMFVRIRRFNIIIQPNLKIFYELYLYDAKLRRERCESSYRRFCWASLCREIHQLNHFYIH